MASASMSQLEELHHCSSTTSSQRLYLRYLPGALPYLARALTHTPGGLRSRDLPA